MRFELGLDFYYPCLFLIHTPSYMCRSPKSSPLIIKDHPNTQYTWNSMLFLLVSLLNIWHEFEFCSLLYFNQTLHCTNKKNDDVTDVIITHYYYYYCYHCLYGHCLSLFDPYQIKIMTFFMSTLTRTLQILYHKFCFIFKINTHSLH